MKAKQLQRKVPSPVAKRLQTQGSRRRPSWALGPFAYWVSAPPVVSIIKQNSKTHKSRRKKDADLF